MDGNRRVPGQRTNGTLRAIDQAGRRKGQPVTRRDRPFIIGRPRDRQVKRGSCLKGSRCVAGVLAGRKGQRATRLDRAIRIGEQPLPRPIIGDGNRTGFPDQATGCIVNAHRADREIATSLDQTGCVRQVVKGRPRRIARKADGCPAKNRPAGIVQRGRHDGHEGGCLQPAVIIGDTGGINVQATIRRDDPATGIVEAGGGKLHHARITAKLSAPVGQGATRRKAQAGCPVQRPRTGHRTGRAHAKRAGGKDAVTIGQRGGVDRQAPRCRPGFYDPRIGQTTRPRRIEGKVAPGGDQQGG
ncbi:hypothetical protein MSKU15_0167 [Komagataeibacter diospyri]|nr:hypothetical protein MSKU15_0167 [Komagataeibacter diospyri]